MPSVFFVSLMSASPWGGSEELWFRTARCAASAGWKVGCAVYHWPEKEKKLEPLRQLGCDIIYLPNKGRTKRNLAERLQNKLSKIKAKAAVRALQPDRYDLVVVNMGAFEIIMPAWRQLYRRLDRYLVLYHNYREKEVFSGEKKQAIENLARGARLNLVASRRIAEVLKAGSGINLPNVDILFNPISFPRPQLPAAYPPLKNGRFRLIMLAALEVSRKAQDSLIRALAAPEWRERNWSLHLYGAGRDASMLRNLISSLGMEDRVFLEGHSADVKTLLENAHLLLQLTHQDAMPLAVVEAMAMARPVAVSRIGDMPDWVKEDENGWISPNASVEAIGAVLEKAWGRRESWAGMGIASFNLFDKKFPSSVEEDFLEKLKGLLKP